MEQQQVQRNQKQPVIRLRSAKSRRPFLQFSCWEDPDDKINHDGRCEVFSDGQLVISTHGGNRGRLYGCRDAFLALFSLLGVKPQNIGGQLVSRPNYPDVGPGLVLCKVRRLQRWQIFVRWDLGEAFERGAYHEMKNQVELTRNGKVVLSILSFGNDHVHGACWGMTRFLGACGQVIDMPRCLRNRHIMPNYDRQD